MILVRKIRNLLSVTLGKKLRTWKSILLHMQPSISALRKGILKICGKITGEHTCQKFCIYMGEKGSVKTCILSYFLQRYIFIKNEFLHQPSSIRQKLRGRGRALVWNTHALLFKYSFNHRPLSLDAVEIHGFIED